MKAYFLKMYRLGLLATGMTVMASPTFAQDAGKTEQNADGMGFREIIVTAQRRDESLQKVPVSVSVLTADALVKQAVTSEQDLRVNTAGLTVRATGGSNQLNYAIRGQSLDAFSDARPGVLPYFNEIQIAGDAGSSAFYDLQSVQVLKGPQGTLFGRSATGGAVLFTTVKPKEDFGGYVSGALGNYDLRKMEGAINVPVVKDVLLARVAGFYQKRDGYQYNILTDSRLGGFERFGLRGSLEFRLGDSFTNNLVVDYAHFDGQSMTGLIAGLKPDAATPAASALIYSPLLDTIFNFPGAFATVNAANPGTSPSGLAGDLADQQARGPFVTNVDYLPLFNAKNVVVTNSSVYDISDSLQIKNLFGYAHIKSSRQFDVDGTAYAIDNTFNASTTAQYTNELQLLGDAGPLKYVVGGYFSSERTQTFIEGAFFDLLPLAPPANVVFDYTKKNRTLAAYAQGTLDLSEITGLEGLGFTAGIRYTNEKAEIALDPAHGSFGCATDGCGTGLPPSSFSNNQSTTSKNLSWTVGLQYQVNSQLLLYVTSRRAFKGAGFNGGLAPLIGTGSVGGNRYEEERLTDVEAGFKFQGRVGSIPFRFNADVYQNWVKNGQRVAFAFVSGGAPGAITVNVPKSRVRGLEADMVVNPTEWLSIGGTFVYTDAKFLSQTVSIQGTPTLFGPYPDTPKTSGSIFAQVEAPLSGGLKAVARGDYFSQSATVYTSTQRTNTGARIPGYGIANFRLGLEDEDAGWSVSAYLKNAFKKTYYVGGLATAELLQINTIVPGDPRTFMVEARFKF
ncbi:TonB-dependent receptor [Sphingobium sp. 15-1]|uniref:TonB-dependent receptor n=1 Tax=Sphingobium sp. 15-1 TaxID=2729616 RepID=UPI00159C2C9C|nr:TonB-dependent receptor [Sphingobium sp. 15-1]